MDEGYYDLDDRIDQISANISAMQAELNELKNDISARHDDQIAQMNVLDGELETLRTTISEIKRKLDDMQKDENARHNYQIAQMNAVDGSCQELRTEISEIHTEISGIKRKLDNMQKIVGKLTLPPDNLTIQDSKMARKQNEMQVEPDDRKKRVDREMRDDSHPSKVRLKKRSKDRRAARSDKNASSDESEAMCDQPGSKRMRCSGADDVHNLKEEMADMVQKNAKLEMDLQSKFRQDKEIKRQLSESSNKTSHENSCIISTLQDLIKSEFSDLKKSSDTTSREHRLMISKIDNLTDKVDHLEEYVEREIGNRNLKKDRCIGDREKKK